MINNRDNIHVPTVNYIVGIARNGEKFMLSLDQHLRWQLNQKKKKSW